MTTTDTVESEFDLRIAYQYFQTLRQSHSRAIWCGLAAAAIAHRTVQQTRWQHTGKDPVVADHRIETVFPVADRVAQQEFGDILASLSCNEGLVIINRAVDYSLNILNQPGTGNGWLNAGDGYCTGANECKHSFIDGVPRPRSSRPVQQLAPASTPAVPPSIPATPAAVSADPTPSTPAPPSVALPHKISTNTPTSFGSQAVVEPQNITPSQLIPTPTRTTAASPAPDATSPRSTTRRRAPSSRRPAATSTIPRPKTIARPVTAGQ